MVTTHVTNAGYVEHVKLSNKYHQWSDDGVTKCYELTYEYREDVKRQIRERIRLMDVAWGKFCYDMTWDEFLARYKMSRYKFKKLREV